MRSTGILDGLKSQLRGKLYDQLKLKNEKAGLNLKDQSNRLSFKLSVSIIADFMQKYDMPYALSVFLPESGISQEILTKSELVELLKLKNDDMVQGRKDLTPLLTDIVDQIKLSGSIRPNMASCYIQTEEAGENAMSLDQKLKKVDYNHMEKLDIERVMPFKSMEEKMIKYKRELDQKYKEDLESEIRRLKDFEISKIRMEEAQKYRQKLQDQREELESLHIQNIKELKLRENEAWERIKNKEREIEKASYEHRQKVLTDEEKMRYRETDVKKTVEMELLLIKQERERLVKIEKEFELKLKDLDVYKMKLEKEHTEAITGHKSDLQREYKDQDFDIHRRKLQIEEDEARIKYDKQRLALIENKNMSLSSELDQTTKDLKELKRSHDHLVKENQELKDQVRILNENLRRETEVLLSRDKENTTIVHENRVLKDLLDDSKRSSQTYKEDQNQLIDNLRLQLNETREMIDKIRENKDKEFKKLKERQDDERRRETEQYQLEYEKLKGEINLMSKRLGQEETYTKELAILNNKLQTNMTSIRGDYRGVTQEVDGVGRGSSSHYHIYGGAGNYGDDEDEESEEIIKRKQAWAELEREQQEVKRNIKSLMKMAPESAVIDNPMLADRVRNVRYEPMKYNQEEDDAKYERKPASKSNHQSKSQQQEQPKSSSNTGNGQQYPSQKRAWTTGTPEKPEIKTKTQSQQPPTQAAQPKQQSPQKAQEKKEEIKTQPVSSYGGVFGGSNYGGTTTTTTGQKPSNTSAQIAQPPVSTTTASQAPGLQTQKTGGTTKAFQEPKFNPLKKKTTGPLAEQTNPPATQPQFPTLAGQQQNFNNQKNKTEQSEVSDLIQDQYDSGFEEDEFLKNKNKKPVAAAQQQSRNIQQQQQVASDEMSQNSGFDEKYDDDFF